MRCCEPRFDAHDSLTTSRMQDHIVNGDSTPLLVRNGVTDVHLRPDAVDESIAYPGPRRISESEVEVCRALIARCTSIGKTDFMFQYEGVNFRGHTDDLSVEGKWFRLRLLRSSPPQLEKLPSPLSPSVVATLMSDRIKRGGLILVAGAPGAGKTTTASAVLVSRLMRYGGLAYTLEDPPEIPLSGWHGPGVCHQGQIPEDPENGWAEAFRGILRSQPSGSTPILFVGELREGSAVRASIQAAQNGFLVLATGFGTDLTEGVKALASLAANADEAALPAQLEALASVLKVVVHQQLRVGKISATILAIPPDSAPAGIIRKGQIHSLRSQVEYQGNLMFASDTPIDLLAPRE